MEADWGNVPQWISAISSAVGFSWGIYLLRTETTRDAVVTARSVRLHRTETAYEVTNNGRQPVFDVLVRRTGTVTEVSRFLKPGDSATVDLAHSEEPVMTYFTDLHSRQWVVDPASGAEIWVRFRWRKFRRVKRE
jgi:hypothetical protein